MLIFCYYVADMCHIACQIRQHGYTRVRYAIGPALNFDAFKLDLEERMYCNQVLYSFFQIASTCPTTVDRIAIGTYFLFRYNKEARVWVRCNFPIAPLMK